MEPFSILKLLSGLFPTSGEKFGKFIFTLIVGILASLIVAGVFYKVFLEQKFKTTSNMDNVNNSTIYSAPVTINQPAKKPFVSLGVSILGLRVGAEVIR